MRTSALLSPLLLALPLALACGDKDDDTGSDAYWFPHCEATETALAFDEASPLGFSAADVAAAVGSEVAAELSWAAGGSTALTLSLAWGSEAVFVDLEEAEPPDDVTSIPDIAVICEDYLRIGAVLGLDSEDGLLAESFPLDLSASAADRASFSLSLAEADFSHPEIFAPFEVDDATSQHPSLSGSFAGGTSQGELSWFAEGTDGDTAWASTDTVGSWSSDAE